MGDFNANVAKGKVKILLPELKRGDFPAQFRQEEKLMVANTWCHLFESRLYTWNAPSDNQKNIIRNQIDFILVDKRYGNDIKGVKAFPGADIGSVHNPVIGKL